MATTPNLGITLLEVGQKEKEVTINEGFQNIDLKVKGKTGWLGKLASDPAPTSAMIGSFYYNTTSSKVKLLIDATTWVQVG